VGDTWEDESDETVLTARLRGYERKYFAGLDAVESLELSKISGPSCLSASSRVIHINPAVAPFSKMCGILILHELIHHKLLMENGDPDEAEKDRFQAEVLRLWERGAYKELL
jgi:hypothetical protein